MILSPERIRFLQTLAPPEPHWGGTGALPLHPDPRDYDMRWIPEIKAALDAGVPETGDLTRWLQGPSHNQGSEPSCVAFSTCNLAAVDEVMEGGAWEIFNGHQLYVEAGGNGTNGVDTRLTLKIATEQGVPGSSGRKKTIASYAFAPQTPGLFRDTLKAAAFAGHVCTIALLLPAPFSWNSGNAPTSAYHQVIGPVGWDATWCWIFNSWGDGWPGDAPRGGLGRVRWDFLEADGLQHSYCYAYTTTPTEIKPPPPPPPPVHTRATITGTATGQVDSLAKGSVYTLASGVNVTLSQIDFDLAPPPPPPPGQLSVTGYSPNPVKAGQSFLINGQGFSGGNLTVSWQGQSLVAQRSSDAQIQATAPSVASTASGAVTVRVEGQTADGPPLTVTAGDVNPGQLKVTVLARRYSRGLVGVWAYVQEPGSAELKINAPMETGAGEILPPWVLNPEADGYVAASVTCQIKNGGQSISLEAHTAQANGTPAVWQVSGAPPSPATVTAFATAADGRTGTASVTI